MNIPTPSPLISVVIPSYNRAEFIVDAIDSILDQTYQNIEVILVDDGSTDATEEIVSKYHTVQYIKIPNNGVGNARNVGIEHAQGEYVAFLDSDDVWLKHKLELQLAHYLEHPDAGIISGSCRYIDRSGNDISTPDICPKIISNEELEIFSGLPGGPCNVLIRKSILDDIGGFDTTLLRSEDRDFWMRISRKYPVYGIQAITCKIRLHNTPRHKVNLDATKNNRVEVNSRIIDNKIKRKADAWMYYCFFKLHHNQGEYLQAIFYLFISFFTYPTNIHPRCERLRVAAQKTLPKSVFTIFSSLKSIVFNNK